MNRLVLSILVVFGSASLGCQTGTPVGKAAGQLIWGTAAAHAQQQNLLQSPPADGPPGDPGEAWNTAAADAWRENPR